jgi:hypothetical protein
MFSYSPNDEAELMMSKKPPLPMPAAVSQGLLSQLTLPLAYYAEIKLFIRQKTRPISLSDKCRAIGCCAHLHNYLRTATTTTTTTTTTTATTTTSATAGATTTATNIVRLQRTCVGEQCQRNVSN